jgi:hypothetical protein
MKQIMPHTKKAKKVVWIAAVLVTILTIAGIVLYPRQDPDIKILDPRIHVKSCTFGVANWHIENIDGSAKSLVQDVLHSVKLRKEPSRSISSAFSPTSLTTPSLGIPVRFTWAGALTNFTADLTDPNGTVMQLKNDAQHIEEEQTNAQVIIIWILSPAPTNTGNYVFRMRLGTNGQALLSHDFKMPSP